MGEPFPLTGFTRKWSHKNLFPQILFKFIKKLPATLVTDSLFF